MPFSSHVSLVTFSLSHVCPSLRMDGSTRLTGSCNLPSEPWSQCNSHYSIIYRGPPYTSPVIHLLFKLPLHFRSFSLKVMSQNKTRSLSVSCLDYFHYLFFSFFFNGTKLVSQIFISVVNLSCSNSLLHAEHAVKGEASMTIGSTEMTCCAVCQLLVLMLKRAQGVCLCVLYARMLFGSVPLTSNTCASCLYST